MKLTYTKTHILSKLHDELINANIPLVEGISPVQGNGETVYIYVPDDTPQEVIDKIDAIVNAHDPTPLPQPPTMEEQLMLALTDAQLKVAEQQELINSQQQLIDQLALAFTDSQLQQKQTSDQQQQLIDQLALAVTELQLQGGTV